MVGKVAAPETTKDTSHGNKHPTISRPNRDTNKYHVRQGCAAAEQLWRWRWGKVLLQKKKHHMNKKAVAWDAIARTTKTLTNKRSGMPMLLLLELLPNKPGGGGKIGCSSKNKVHNRHTKKS